MLPKCYLLILTTLLFKEKKAWEMDANNSVSAFVDICLSL